MEEVLRFEAKPVFLPEAYRQSVIDRAEQSARRLGISGAAWDSWRKGFGIRRDLLMVIDPEGEAERIMKAGRRSRRAAACEFQPWGIV